MLIIVCLMDKDKHDILKWVVQSRFRDIFDFEDVERSIAQTAGGNIENYTHDKLRDFLHAKINGIIDETISELKDQGFWDPPLSM